MNGVCVRCDFVTGAPCYHLLPSPQIAWSKVLIMSIYLVESRMPPMLGSAVAPQLDRCSRGQRWRAQSRCSNTPPCSDHGVLQILKATSRFDHDCLNLDRLHHNTKKAEVILTLQCSLRCFPAELCSLSHSSSYHNEGSASQKILRI